MSEKPLIVVALGGNAISTPDEEGNVGQQFANSAKTARHLADLVEAGNQLVVTHGNGPQIGNFMLRNEVAAGVIYPLPMEVAVAHVQGGMGFMIAQTLTNELARRGHPQIAIAFVTTVLVDAADPDFSSPSKPVGTVLNADEADYHREEGWHITEIAPGQFRRVVPSPTPIQIMEIESIQRAVEGGDLIIACGGGGIPVVLEPDIGLRGAAAVIDKDLASALLATELDGD
ncbi:MAG: carbamate kinase, partial [Rhodothermales bacterium]